ncbi:MAG: EAL domain-containing protein [Candidatus Baltobacteraceae bacterium]
MSTWLTNGDLRKRFSLLFEQNPAVVLALDGDHRIVEMNPAAVHITGYTRERAIGSLVQDFIPSGSHDRERAMFARAMAGETVRFRCDAYAADGQIIQFEKTLAPVRDDAARVVGAYAVLEPSAERLRVQQTVLSQPDALTDLEHDFRALFERNPDAVCLLAPDEAILDANDAAIALAGVPRDALLGQNFRAFLQGTDLHRGWSFFRRALEGETVRYDIAAHVCGRRITLDVTMFPKHTRGVIAGVYGIMQDTTERRAAQRRNEMQAQRVRDLYLLATTSEYTDAHVMSALQTGCRLLGMESGAIVESAERGAQVELRYDSLELFGGDDAALLAVAQQVDAHREPVLSHSDAQPHAIYRSWIGTKILAGGTTHGVLVFFSIVQRGVEFEEIDHDTLALMSALVGAALERRRTRSHLRTMAYFDSLTGLPNRVFFQDRLRDALIDARGHTKTLAVVFFDLDRFKDINDSLGHAMGDRFLQMVAHRLVDAVGNTGVVARMGGDEFIVLLTDRDADNAETVAAGLLQVIERPYILEGYEQHIGASAGISVYPEDARDDEALIRNADMAMYHAKARGGGAHSLYTRALEEPLRSRVDQEKMLRRAIERGDFRLHYQPVVDAQTQRIVAVEALVRWMDHQRGLMYPDNFIPIAEATGLIVEIGEWVVGEAARSVIEWRRGGLADLRLSVNISPRQFHQRDLCERISAELERHDFPPDALKLEITESMALTNVEHAIGTIRKLKETGIRISVDDFGTGHSSLNYLRRFEIDEIKIDRSFVAGIGHQLSDETIVKAILAMGRSLGLCIVAEGVETAAQYEFLRAAGCERVQGFYFSRPLDGEQFHQLLETRGTLLAPG